MVVKLHHAVADGSAAVALLRNVVEAATVAPDPSPAPDPWTPEALPGRGRLVARAPSPSTSAGSEGFPAWPGRPVTSARASERRRRTFEPMPPIPLHHIPKTSLNVSLDAEPAPSP